MKKLAILAMVLMLSFGAFASTASASDYYPGACCCRVIICGTVFICDLDYGMVVPNAEVKVLGDLQWYFPFAQYADAQGFYCFQNDNVKLGNYFQTKVAARAEKWIGQWSFLKYYGESGSFAVDCYAAGQQVGVTANIPVWIQ